MRKEVIVVGLLFLSLGAFAQTPEVVVTPEMNHQGVTNSTTVTDPKWNASYAKEHGIHDMEITPEDFTYVGDRPTLTEEEPPVEREDVKKKDKSLWDKLFGNLGPQGVDAQDPWYLSGPIRRAPIKEAIKIIGGGTHAVGQHHCWSDEAVYNCRNTITNALDCNEAGIRLKLDDCCPTYVINGKRLTNPRSISFRMLECAGVKLVLDKDL